MKRRLGIVGTVVATYAIGFFIAWTAATSLATRKTKESLRGSRDSFAHISDEMVDCVLWYASILIFDEIGSTLGPVTAADARRLAEKLHIDELNIVNAKGVTVASNLPSEVGYVFASEPVTAEFLDVLDPARPVACYGQPYRPSTSKPYRLTKYYAVAFPDRSGFLQLGFTLDRLQRTYTQVDPAEYFKWRIGRYGHFEVVDRNRDGRVDREKSFSALPSEGVMESHVSPTEGEVHTCTFAYAGLVFRAVLPAREFQEQRDLLLTVGGISLAVILGFLTYFVLRLLNSSEKLDALHRSAEARNAADLAVARVIQMSSLPRGEFFRTPHLDSAFDAVTYPAREVGGDFYSLFELSDHRVVFLVADVSGKGVPAAMFMHVAANTILAGFRVVNVAEEAVAAINNYLCEHNEAEMFVTVWVGVLDPRTGEVEYVNAGHNRPYVVRRDGRVERVDGRGGLFLGMFPRRAYRSERLRLEPGDRLFLYTDGVTEAMDAAGRTYGTDRLVRLLERMPERLCAAVKADVDDFVAGTERSDDLTVMELSWYGRPPRVERTFAATVSDLGEAVAFLRAETKLTNEKQVARLLNAADEMLSNVVNYSGAKSISLAVENIPGRCRVTITDNGAAYNPLTHADPDTHAPLQRRDVGGLGILMAKKLVNSIDYRRADGANVVTLVQINVNEGYRKHN